MKVFFSQCVCVLLSIWCLRGSSGTVGEQLWVGNYLKEEKWFLITHALSQVWILKTYFEVETLINDWRECGVSSLPLLTVLLFIRQFCCLFLMSNSITLEWLDVKHALTDIFGCRNKMQLYWYDKNLSKQFPTYLHTQQTQSQIWWMQSSTIFYLLLAHFWSPTNLDKNGSLAHKCSTMFTSWSQTGEQAARKALPATAGNKALRVVRANQNTELKDTKKHY